jgi:tRNA nucleotidyltransferase (CCA-adding enzyme)
LSRNPVEEAVLSRIRPKHDEHEHIRGVAERLVGAVDASGRAKGMVVGSIARNTWVTGDRDLDVFMLFDPALSRIELEEQGLDLARRIAGEFGSRIREKYAEHPYINTSVEGLDIDLVPCYAVKSASEIQSAVDRTPFHTLYIRDRIGGFVEDVLLLKQFAKAGGMYGSDQMTEGFAGYLCELLVLHYGGFTPLLVAAAGWKPGQLIDIEGHRERDFTEPLVVVDPVDPNRNVAASLSLTRMFEFVELARGYLRSPALEFFFRPAPADLGREAFKERLRERGTHLYAITFTTPHAIPDVVVPQLRKSLEAIVGMLERYGFVVNRADCCMGEQHCMLIIELLVEVLPPVKRHMGPPLWNPVNAEKFFEKYRDGVFSGPYVEEGRYYVEISRRHTHADELLGSTSPLKVALGKHVKRAMQSGWTLLKGDEVWQEEFAAFVTAFLEHKSPLTRILEEQMTLLP